MRSKRWGSTLLVAVFAACGGGESGESEAVEMEAPPAEAPAEAPAGPAMAAELPEGVTPEMVAAGESLFNGGVCAACHGPNGAGVDGLGPNLADATWLNGDGSFDAIVGLVTNGVPQPKGGGAPMPPKGGNAGLTDDQVRDIAAYVYSISHAATAM